MHVDFRSGNDSASGATPLLARKTLAGLRNVLMKPGDSLLFARGSQWARESLYVTGNGKADSPIVVGAYGNASLGRPHLANTGMLLVLRNASHVVVQDLELSGARAGCVEMRDSTVSHAVVRRIEAHDCGGGIDLSGTDIVVEDNLIHDGHMVVNTKETMDDDYGATGIGFSRLDGCKVRGNRLWNLSAPSFDYGEDGGAFEFWKTVRKCDISGNFAYKVNGFTEFGGQKGDSAISISVHHNVAFQNGPIACFHIHDSASLFGVGYDSVRFDNNLSVTRHGKPWSYHVIADGGLIPSRDRIKIRNNIFVTDTSNYYNYQETHSLDPTWLHEANLIWNPVNNPFSTATRVKGQGEVYANPLFLDDRWNATAAIDTVLAHYGLQPSSPARGTGQALGYETDYFGKPAAPGGIVDMGPFAHGSYEPVFRGGTSANPTLRAMPGFFEFTAPRNGAAKFEILLVDVSGRNLMSPLRGVLEAGASQRFALDVPRSRPFWAQVRWTTGSDEVGIETLRIPPTWSSSR